MKHDINSKFLKVIQKFCSTEASMGPRSYSLLITSHRLSLLDTNYKILRRPQHRKREEESQSFKKIHKAHIGGTICLTAGFLGGKRVTCEDKHLHKCNQNSEEA